MLRGMDGNWVYDEEHIKALDRNFFENLYMSSHMPLVMFIAGIFPLCPIWISGV